MVLLQAERLTIDLVKDRKIKLQALQTALHVSDTRVNFLLFLFFLSEVFFDSGLLQALLVVDVVCEVISHCLQSLFFMLCLPLINTGPLHFPKHGYVDLCP